MAFKDKLPRSLVSRLEWVKRFIIENPEKFNMNDWCAWSSCGTTGCIAGWMYMGTLKSPPIESSDRRIAKRVFKYADSLLSGRHPELFHLFYLCRWPGEFKIKGSTTPDLAVKRIDYFLEHGI